MGYPVRHRFVLALAAALIGTGVLIVGAAPAAAATITLNPVADGYVQSDQPDAKFGTATSLKVDGSPATTSYLKFNVQGLSGAPAKATLRVYKSLSTTTAITLRRVTDTTWGETTLTYNHRPAPGGTAIIPPTPWGTNVWLSYDVTPLVTGNGLVSFALDTTSSTSKSLPSREAATNKPELVIEPASASGPASVTVAVGGDVACGTTETYYNGGDGTATACRMKATSDLVLGMNAQRAFALGDLQYNSGSPTDFNISYANSWGRFKNITQPVVGNHEYGTSGAAGYFGYFGNAATPLQPGCVKSCQGYYSFDVPVDTTHWHVVVINSECTRIDGGVGCAVGSPQYNWLANDLATHATLCTAVLSHRPRWSSNSFASPDIQPLVDLMSAKKVDLLLTGHAHSYERFAPQDASAQPDSTGITEIIVGTGGRDSQGFGTVVPNSLVRKNKIFGVMNLALTAGGYRYSFVPDPTTPFSDSGSGTCH
jgi:hypothetical protein